MKSIFTTKRLCRAGVIAALYVALTYAFGGLSYGGFLQIRPAEALCVLPLFYIEAIPALWIGCMLSNLTSPFLFYDVVFGALATLLASIITYLVGVFFKKHGARLFFGGLPPVLVNAFVIPLIIVFLCGDTGGAETLAGAYFFFVGSMLLTQSLWVYALGAPLYFAVKRIEERKLLN